MTSKLPARELCAMVLAVTVACGRSPVAPSNLALTAGSTTEGTNARPSSGTPHLTVFTGGISGNGPLTGSIAGVDGGTLRAQARGSYTWTLGPLLNDGYCEGRGATVVDAGLVGNLLSGALTLDANEGTSFGERLSLTMTGVVAPNGQTWEIRVDTVGYPISISGGTAGVTVDVPNTVIGFTRVVKGRSEPTIRCAVAFAIGITPQ